MFYSERKRHEAIANRESAGENLWTLNIPDPLRVKLLRLVDLVEDVLNSSNSFYNPYLVLGKARDLLIADLGRAYLISPRSTAEADMQAFINSCSGEELPDVLESIYKAIDEGDSIARDVSLNDRFAHKINELLESYRICYSLEAGTVIEFSSREMHVGVVVPILQLLTKPGWELVEAPYSKAIQEIADNCPDDAVTDAATAMQEALRKVGCTGKDFNALVASAKNTVLKGYDAKYIGAIEMLIAWLSATRANKGDSHKASITDKSDAWLTVHLVGALILHLSESTK